MEGGTKTSRKVVLACLFLCFPSALFALVFVYVCVRYLFFSFDFYVFFMITYFLGHVCRRVLFLFNYFFLLVLPSCIFCVDLFVSLVSNPYAISYARRSAQCHSSPWLVKATFHRNARSFNFKPLPASRPFGALNATTAAARSSSPSCCQAT